MAAGEGDGSDSDDDQMASNPGASAAVSLGRISHRSLSRSASISHDIIIPNSLQPHALSPFLVVSRAIARNDPRRHVARPRAPTGCH